MRFYRLKVVGIASGRNGREQELVLYPTMKYI